MSFFASYDPQRIHNFAEMDVYRGCGYYDFTLIGPDNTIRDYQGYEGRWNSKNIPKKSGDYMICRIMDRRSQHLVSNLWYMGWIDGQETTESERFSEGLKNKTFLGKTWACLWLDAGKFFIGKSAGVPLFIDKDHDIATFKFFGSKTPTENHCWQIGPRGEQLDLSLAWSL